MYHIAISPTSAAGSATSVAPSSSTNEEEETKAAQSPKQNADEENVINFCSGNPRIEEQYGKFHLFRSVHSMYSTNNQASEREDKEPKYSCCLCALLVPSYMTPSDFYSFLGAFGPDLKHMRVVRNLKEKHSYMVLIEFHSTEVSLNFYQEYNKKPFHLLDSKADLCKLVFVSSIETLDGDANTPNTMVRFVESTTSDVETSELSSKAKIQVDTNMLSGSIVAPKGMIELPNCPVCLERLDSSVSGITTTLCNHMFHCDCLNKWQREDSSCPVCRYIAPSISDENDLSVCHQCGCSSSLWICVICGNIGCGRYESAHAFEHYKNTGHSYSLEVESQRVWDYTGDGYVHRLMMNKADGKLVELPDRNSMSNERSQIPPVTDASENTYLRNKMEGLSIEYNQLLWSQLETQRKFYEDCLSSIENNQTIENTREIERANRTLQKQCKILTSKLKEVEEENKFHKNMYESLITNQQELQNSVKHLTAENIELKAKLKAAPDPNKVVELEEQIRDLMMFLDTREKVESSPMKNELCNGSVVGVAAAAAPNSRSSSLKSGQKSGRKKGKR